MSVTVLDLIESLKKLDPELVVVLASDGEGNSYSTLDESLALGVFYDDGPLAGEFREAGEDEDESDDYLDIFDGDGDLEDEDEAEDIAALIDLNASPCVVLWPAG